MQDLVYLAERHLAAHVGEVGAPATSNASDHVARRAVPLAKEKLLPGNHISFGLHVVGGRILGSDPPRQRLELIRGKLERRHAPATVQDDVLDLGLRSTSQAAAVDQRWTTVRAGRSFAVAAFTMSREDAVRRVLRYQRQHDKKDARPNQRTESPTRYIHRTMLHAVAMAETPTAVVETFDEIFRDRQLQVLRIAYRIVGNWADAEDVAQEAFVRLHKHMAGLPNAAALGSWLYRVTVNLSLDRTRKARPSQELPEQLPASAASADAELIRRQQQERLMAALSRLPARERAAVVLREIEGLSTAEVAEILGSAEATVRSQVASAVIRLRKMFDEEQGA